MEPRASLARREKAALAALVLFAVGYPAVLLAVHSPPVLLDDAFIAFRYAQNLARGAGLVFNPEERVWGFTSPAHTLLLSGLAAVGIAPPVAASVIYCVLLGGSAAVWWELLRDRLHTVSRLALGALLVTIPETLAYVGLETSLLVFLQSLFLLLLLRGRPRTGALVGSLACLTRPDAALLVVPVLLLHRPTRNARCFALFAAPGALWLSFTALYYGDVLPQTFHAKQGGTGLAAYFVQSYLIMSRSGSRLGIHPFLVPVAGLALLRRRAFRSEPVLAWSLAAYPWGLYLAYAIIGSPAKHSWEYFAGFYFAYAASAILVLSVVEAVSRPRPRAGIAFVIVAALALAGSQVRMSTALLERRHAGRPGTRYVQYVRLARWIRENLEPDPWIAFDEPGTIAYYSDARFVDLAGLVTQDASRPTTYRIVRGTEGEAPAVQEEFAVVHELSAPGFHRLTVLKRR